MWNIVISKKNCLKGKRNKGKDRKSQGRENQETTHREGHENTKCEATVPCRAGEIKSVKIRAVKIGLGETV
jgi:hypothetical protein